MNIRRAPVVWKREDDKILIMSKKGIFLLSEKASRLWESLNDECIDPGSSRKFLNTLLEAGFAEAVDD